MVQRQFLRREAEGSHSGQFLRDFPRCQIYVDGKLARKPEEVLDGVSEPLRGHLEWLCSQTFMGLPYETLAIDSLVNGSYLGECKPPVPLRIYLQRERCGFSCCVCKRLRYFDEDNQDRMLVDVRLQMKLPITDLLVTVYPFNCLKESCRQRQDQNHERFRLGHEA
ncbi:MAG: hypothetical protein ACYCOU_03125 [Sulfobacillus sp.]